MVLTTPELRDAYTALLSAIRLNAPVGAGRSILITSTQPSEGKTTVASCLAITASLAGQSVLLIDGDLRRPSLAAAAGIADGVGLTEILEGRTEAAEATHQVELFETAREAGRVSIMAAGRKSPDVLLAVDWAKARTMFQALYQNFDIVLFDSPPILAVNDALLLANIVDGVLLVIAAGSADRSEVRRVKAQLEPLGTPVIGAVLNQFDPKIHGRPSQPYRDYYDGSR
jgi:capsular exopolysaccharide synthesis family protein